MKYNKIRIIGPAGCGKTYLSEKISNKLKIPRYDLDDIFWDKKYTIRRKDKEITKKIEQILKKPKWILEGIQYYSHNIPKTFQKANTIILVNPSTIVNCCRIIKRYTQRRRNKEETAKGTLKLLKFPLSYNLNIKSKSIKAYAEVFNQYPKKVIILKNKKQINKFLTNLK